MPKVFINYPEGTFSASALDALAGEITTIGRECEKLPVAIFGFMPGNTAQARYTTAETREERRSLLWRPTLLQALWVLTPGKS
jgi:hypothetical protein